MAKYLLSSLLILFCLHSYIRGQPIKQGDNWIIGALKSNAIKFKANGQIHHYSLPFDRYFSNGSSAISDTNGNLLLTCNGFTIYDTLGVSIKDGNDLCPPKIMDLDDYFSSYTQSSLILPFSNRGIYYALMATSTDSNLDYWLAGNGAVPFDMILSNKVDITADNGKPAVVQGKVPILSNTLISKTRAAACQHANGVDWWYLKQGHDSNIVYKFLVTADSIFGPFVQRFSSPLFGYIDVQGQSVFNNEGTKYATIQPANLILYPTSAAKLALWDFDRCTGNLSNLKTYDVPRMPAHDPFYDSLYNGYGDDGANGLAFSSNNKYLYISKFSNILQLDLSKTDSAQTWYTLAAMDTVFQQFNSYTTMQMAPDGKIYIGRYHGISDNWSTINKPDLHGSAAEFCKGCFKKPGYYIKSPSMMPYFGTGKSPINCIALGIDKTKTSNGLECIILENPVDQILKLKHSQAQNITFIMYDIIGNVVKRIELNGATNYSTINVSELQSGTYLFKCIFDSNKTVNGKILID
jgi:hypothetical protein